MAVVGLRVWALAPISSGLAEENGPPTPDRQSRVKAYNRVKLTLSLLGTVLSFFIALAVVVTGFSQTLASVARAASTNDYLAFLVFTFLFGVIEIAVGFPLKFYSSFSLEHRYGLSNQTIFRWLWEQTKGLLVGALLILPLLLFFLYSLKRFGDVWWLPVGVVVFFFTVVLARLAPKILFPLFYKFTPLDRESLKERINRLCSEAGFHVSGVFSFNMSKNTKKANAAFAGMGRTKRVIIGDTLLEKFSDEEIEAVLAHELGHYQHGHIWKGILINTAATFLGLFITSRLYAASLSAFGFNRIDELAALPLLGLWLGVFGIVAGPFMNAISRKYEYEADRYAVQKGDAPLALVGALKKLAEMNLADTAPNSIVEFLFYSHPSIEKRIRHAERI
jgi:STE24 endopeptidase